MDLESRQLHDLCSQFEQILLVSLLPASLFKNVTASEETGDAGNDALSCSAAPDLFREALATAIERRGGVGLGVELARAFSGSPS